MIKIFNKEQYINLKKIYISRINASKNNARLAVDENYQDPEEALAELELEYQKIFNAKDGDEDIGINGYMYVYSSEKEAFLLKSIDNKEELEDAKIEDNKGE